MTETNRLQDNSGDRKYFTQIPQIVWSLARSPYDLTLWHTIKMIAGENGECYLSSANLATLAMMSIGKVADCRKYLLKVGLLEGELRKQFPYPQPVWHLRIPDLWQRNLDWRQGFDKLSDRVKLKIIQKKEQRDTSEKDIALPGERLLSESEIAPPGEQGLSPHEQGLSPDVKKEEPASITKEQPTIVDENLNTLLACGCVKNDKVSAIAAMPELTPDAILGVYARGKQNRRIKNLSGWLISELEKGNWEPAPGFYSEQELETERQLALAETPVDISDM
jgi:hypothetical protein